MSRLKECGEATKFSPQELGKLLNTSYIFIDKYERDEMKPSIDVARNITKHVDTTVGYLLGETEEMDVLKDPIMLKRLNELDKERILYALYGLLRDAKTR